MTNIPVTVVSSQEKNDLLISDSDKTAIQETLQIQSIPGLTQKILSTYNENIMEGETYDPDEEW